MTDEERQRQMDFIIEQQAQFITSFQKADERMTRIEELVGRLAVVTTQGFKDFGEKVNALVNAQIKTEERVSTLAEKLTELTEAQAHTDERLSVLINVVERYFSEGRNGQSRGEY